MAAKKTVVGVLTLLVTATIISVIFLGGAKVDLAKDYTKFSLQENGLWAVKATERNILYDSAGVKLLKTSTILNKSIVSDGIFTTRTSTYTNGAVISDIYFFKDVADITKFPASHTVNIKNCENCKYVWEVRDLKPVLKTVTPTSPLTFGRMKVEWIGGTALLKKSTYSKGILTVTFNKIEKDFNFYSRVFDPPAQTTATINFVVPYNYSNQMIYVLAFNTSTY